MLIPLDISSYVYCPILQGDRKYQKISEPLSIFENSIRLSLIEAERSALLKDSIVTPRKLARAWDNVWWPTVMENGYNIQEAEKKSLKATIKFVDYCKYDISDHLYPTAGVNIESKIQIGNSILVATADLLKVNLEESKRNIVIVNFDRKDIDINKIALDPGILSTVYAFHKNRGETVTYVAVDLNEKKEKLNIISSVFRPADIADIRKMLYHIERGIHSNIRYRNLWLCKECRECSNFNYLTRKNTS